MKSVSQKQSGFVTTFRKAGSEAFKIKGTRISSHNAQLLTSTGSSTLDFFIGGGLAVGTICLLEEDRYGSYSSVLLKYFLAEGIARGHRLFVSSGDAKSAGTIIKELPSIKVPEFKPVDGSSSGIEPQGDLKIAWRYQNQSNSTDIRSDSQNHGFDLSKNIPEETLSKSFINLHDISDHSDHDHDTDYVSHSYSRLFTKLKTEIVSNGLQTSKAKKCNNILRIGICSLGSSMFSEENCNRSGQDILRFLYALKSLLRSSFAVAVITVPSYLLQDLILRNRIRQMCDTVISLESFVGSDKKSNPLYKEFHGLIQITKLPVLNTFMYPMQSSDLAFKLKKKGFIIERLHLPPDFEDSPDSAGLLCSGGGLPNKLDF